MEGKMKKAIKITPEGEVSTIDIAGDELGILQGAVGGWVQAIDLDDAVSLWVNEECKMLRQAHNVKAQALWDAAFGPETDYIVGTAVITGTPDARGNTRGLSQAVIDKLSATLAGVDTPRLVEI